MPDAGSSLQTGSVDGPEGPRPPQPWFRRFAKLWGFALFLVLVAWWFREILLPFIFALVLAYVLAPVVSRLAALHIGRRHVPRGVAVILCYVVLLTGTGIFFAGFLPRLSAEVARIGAEAPKIWDRAQREWTPAVARWLERHFPSLIPQDVGAKRPAEPPGPATDVGAPPGTLFTVTPLASGEYAITAPANGLEIERIDDKHVVVRPREDRARRRLEDILKERLFKALEGLEGEIAELVKFGQALITGVISIIIKLVLVLMVAAYILIDINRLHAFARSVVPVAYRGDYDSIVSGIDRGLSGVIRGQLFVCVWNGVLTYVGLLIFQVKYALVLGALAGIMSLIPIFGSIMSSIPIVLVALVSADSFDLPRGLAVLAWIVGVHFIEANFVSPKIMGAAAKMHPVLVVFALIAGEHTYGVVGAILAVPMASIIQTIFVYFRSRAWKGADASSSTVSLR
jgi:predicted PurR-regulated permease PerM